LDRTQTPPKRVATTINSKAAGIANAPTKTSLARKK
jgi:hypothetical protein